MNSNTLPNPFLSHSSPQVMLNSPPQPEEFEIFSSTSTAPTSSSSTLRSIQDSTSTYGRTVDNLPASNSPYDLATTTSAFWNSPAPNPTSCSTSFSFSNFSFNANNFTPRISTSFLLDATASSSPSHFSDHPPPTSVPRLPSSQWRQHNEVSIAPSEPVAPHAPAPISHSLTATFALSHASQSAPVAAKHGLLRWRCSQPKAKEDKFSPIWCVGYLRNAPILGRCENCKVEKGVSEWYKLDDGHYEGHMLFYHAVEPYFGRSKRSNASSEATTLSSKPTGYHPYSRPTPRTAVGKKVRPAPVATPAAAVLPPLVKTSDAMPFPTPSPSPPPATPASLRPATLTYPSNLDEKVYYSTIKPYPRITREESLIEAEKIHLESAARSYAKVKAKRAEQKAAKQMAKLQSTSPPTSSKPPKISKKAARTLPAPYATPSPTASSSDPFERSPSIPTLPLPPSTPSSLQQPHLGSPTRGASTSFASYTSVAERSKQRARGTCQPSYAEVESESGCERASKRRRRI